MKQNCKCKNGLRDGEGIELFNSMWTIQNEALHYRAISSERNNELMSLYPNRHLTFVNEVDWIQNYAKELKYSDQFKKDIPDLYSLCLRIAFRDFTLEEKSYMYSDAIKWVDFTFGNSDVFYSQLGDVYNAFNSLGLYDESGMFMEYARNKIPKEGGKELPLNPQAAPNTCVCSPTPVVISEHKTEYLIGGALVGALLTVGVVYLESRKKKKVGMSDGLSSGRRRARKTTKRRSKKK